MKPIRIATAWLSGCSGCHMSLLNLHGRLPSLFGRCELVYSPFMDIKEYPSEVDICLVEGAVGNRDNRELALLIRERTKIVASMGDCAVNGNVSALRNPRGLPVELCGFDSYARTEHEVPRLLATVLPLHQVIPVDLFIPGCPPEPERIEEVINRLLAESPP